MKLTFAYDGVLFYDSNGNWFGRNYADLEKRYSLLSDDITYLMRTKEDDKASKKMAEMPQNTKVVSVPNFLSPKGYINNKKQAEKIIREQVSKTDCVIVRLPGMISQIAIKYAIMYKKPYIVEVVGCVWDSLFHHSMKGKLLAPFEFFFTKRAIKRSQYVIYVTNDFLQKRYPTNGKSVGISDVIIRPIQSERLEDSYNNHDIEKIIHVGTAGAVNISYKGQEFVIKALAKLKGITNKRYIYHIAGGGDQSRLLEIAKKNKVSNDVIFEGCIPHQKMNEWYDSLDIYIQPSTVEGLPRALLEAMSREITCLGSNVGGIPELLPTECLFSIGNVDKIASLLNHCSSDWMEKESKKCYIKSMNYREEILKKKRDDFYKEFLNDQGW